MSERNKSAGGRRAGELVFKMLLHAQSREAGLPLSFAVVCLAAESLVQACTVVQPRVRRVEAGLHEAHSQQKYSSGLLLLTVVYFFAMIAIHVVLIIVHARKHKAAGLLEFSIYMTTAFTYIVYPLMISLLGGKVAKSLDSTGDSSDSGAAAWPLLLVLAATLYSMLVARAMFSYVPSRAPLASASVAARYFRTAVLAAVQLLSAYSSLATRSVSSALLFAALVQAVSARVYRRHAARRLAVFGSACLLALQVAACHLEQAGTGAAAIWFLLSGVVLAPPLLNLSDRLGSPSLEEARRDSRKMHQYLMDSFLARDLADRRRDSLPSLRPTDDPVALLEAIGAARRPDELHYVNLILVCAMDSKRHVKTIAQSFERLARSRSEHFFSSFDAYLLKTMWESKLDALYKGKIKDDDGGKPGMAEVFAEMEKYVAEERLDLFGAIDAFAHFAGLVAAVNAHQAALFDLLSGSPRYSSRALLARNRATLKDRDAIDAAILRFWPTAGPLGLYSYFYPMLIFYYSLIKYDIEKTDYCIMLYKKKLHRVLESDRRRDRGLLDASEAVTLKVSLDRERLGRILHVSLNFSHLLQGATYDELLSRNVNCFLPPRFAGLHLSKMKTDVDFSFVNMRRSLEVHMPAGDLRSALVNVRILPVIGAAVCAVCELSFDARQPGCSLLVEADYAVAGSDAAFAALLVRCKVQPNCHLSEVSRLLFAAVRVFEAVGEALRVDADTQAQLRASMAGFQLLSTLEYVQRVNSEQKVVYRPETGSALHAHAADCLKKVKVAAERLLGVRVFRVYVSEERTNPERSHRRLQTAAPDSEESSEAECRTDKAARLAAHDAERPLSVGSAQADASERGGAIELFDLLVELDRCLAAFFGHSDPDSALPARSIALSAEDAARLAANPRLLDLAHRVKSGLALKQAGDHSTEPGLAPSSQTAACSDEDPRFSPPQEQHRAESRPRLPGRSDGQQSQGLKLDSSLTPTCLAIRVAHPGNAAKILGALAAQVRQLGQRVRRGLPFVHLGRLLLAAGYLLAVCAATLLLLDAQSAKLWKASRALFSSYSLLAQLDLQFRGGLQVYVERFLLSNTLLFTEVWGDLLTPEQHAYRLNISRYTYDCACTVLNTKNIVGFLLNEFKNKQITIAYALNNFTANPHLADLPGGILGALLNTRLQVRSYRGWTDEEVSSVGVSASLFVGNFKVCLQAFEAALLAFRPFMVNKGPPFGIPPALVRAKFRDEVPSRIAVMRNSVNGLLEFYADTLRNIKVEAVSTQPQAYAGAQLLIGLGFLCFYLLFLALGLRLAATFHQSLGRLLRLYELLRPEELEFHRAVLLARAAVLQRSRLDELHMAQAYTQLLHLDGDAPGQTGRAKKLKVAAARGGQAVRDHVFFTSKLAAVLTVASLAVVGYVGGVLVHETRSFGLLRRRVAFYTDTYERFARAFDYYLSHSFLSIYGDFVRIGGALPSQLMEEARAEREINELTTYLLSQRSQLHALFDAADATIIDEMLFVDVCAHLNRAKLTYANDVRICRDSGFAGQGFITFMNFERDTLRIIRDMVLADRGFLRGSQTDFLLFPFQTYLFRTASLNFRITHKLVFETLLETVLPAGEKTVFAGLARLEAVLATLKLQTSLLLVAGYLLLLVLAVIVAMRRDLRACKQTLLNIHPNVTLANKSLYRQFDSIFTFQL